MRGRDAFVPHALPAVAGGPSVNDRLCQLLFLIGAVKHASAASMTAVVPYLPYARKDRKTQARDPVTARDSRGVLPGARIRPACSIHAAPPRAT